MAMDGVMAQLELPGYLLVAQPPGNQPEHLLLPRRQEALRCPFRGFRFDRERMLEMPQESLRAHCLALGAQLTQRAYSRVRLSFGGSKASKGFQRLGQCDACTAHFIARAAAPEEIHRIFQQRTGTFMVVAGGRYQPGDEVGDGEERVCSNGAGNRGELIACSLRGVEIAKRQMSARDQVQPSHAFSTVLQRDVAKVTLRVVKGRVG